MTDHPSRETPLTEEDIAMLERLWGSWEPLKRLLVEVRRHRAAQQNGFSEGIEAAARIVSDGQPIDGIHTLIVGREYAKRIRALLAEKPIPPSAAQPDALREADCLLLERLANYIESACALLGEDGVADEDDLDDARDVAAHARERAAALRSSSPDTQKKLSEGEG